MGKSSVELVETLVQRKSQNAVLYDRVTGQGVEQGAEYVVGQVVRKVVG